MCDKGVLTDAFGCDRHFECQAEKSGRCEKYSPVIGETATSEGRQPPQDRTSTGAKSSSYQTGFNPWFVIKVDIPEDEPSIARDRYRLFIDEVDRKPSLIFSDSSAQEDDEESSNDDATSCTQWKIYIRRLRTKHVISCSVCSEKVPFSLDGCWNQADLVKFSRLYDFSDRSWLEKKWRREQPSADSSDEENYKIIRKSCPNWRTSVLQLKKHHAAYAICEDCQPIRNERWKILKIDLPKRNLPKDRYRFYINRWKVMRGTFGTTDLAKAYHVFQKSLYRNKKSKKKRKEKVKLRGNDDVDEGIGLEDALKNEIQFVS